MINQDSEKKEILKGAIRRIYEYCEYDFAHRGDNPRSSVMIPFKDARRAEIAGKIFHAISEHSEDVPSSQHTSFRRVELEGKHYLLALSAAQNDCQRGKSTEVMHLGLSDANGGFMEDKALFSQLLREYASRDASLEKMVEAMTDEEVGLMADPLSVAATTILEQRACTAPPGVSATSAHR